MTTGRDGLLGMLTLERVFALLMLGLAAALLVLVNSPGPSQEAEKLARARSDLRVIGAAIGAHQLERKPLPSTAEGLSALLVEPVARHPGAVPGLLADPVDPWGRPYQWRNPGRLRAQELFSLGPDGIESDDDVGAWNPYRQQKPMDDRELSWSVAKHKPQSLCAPETTSRLCGRVSSTADPR